MFARFVGAKSVVAVTGLVGVTCVLKDVMSGPEFDKKLQAKNKVIIVTGANTGIGRETARSLAKRGAHVYMACRDMEKCEEARKEIVINTHNQYVYCRPCDLSSFESIKNFAATFKREQPRLDVLVNNAGVMRCPKSKTKEGIEMQLGVNHMGHFLLTHLLLDLLKNSGPSRVVVLSSVAHHRGTINKDDLNSDLKYDPAEAYNQSKLANALFTNELSNRLLDTKVTVNAVHPGLVDSDITRHMAAEHSITKVLLYPLSWPFVRTPYAGCQTVLYAALAPELEKVTGKYFSDMKEEPMSEHANNLSLARWLWAVSEKWTKINTIDQ